MRNLPWTWKRFGLSGYVEWRYGAGQVSSNGHDLPRSRGRECYWRTYQDAFNWRGPLGTLGSFSSRCGLWTSSSITWKLARNAKSGSPSQTCWIRICLLTRWPVCTAKSVKPCASPDSHFRDEGPESTPSPSWCACEPARVTHGEFCF